MSETENYLQEWPIDTCHLQSYVLSLSRTLICSKYVVTFNVEKLHWSIN